MGVYDIGIDGIDGSGDLLGSLKGKAALFVNVASKCGLTPQYTDLEKLHEELAPRGFSVVGFPCNQFAGQEPGTDAEVKQFCSTTYGVTFPLFSKIDVNGPSRAPLYAWLTAEDAKPEGAGDIKWNFGKFVVDKTGKVVARFDPTVSPTATEVRAVIDKALA